MKASKVWVICANPVNSSCLVNAVYFNKKEAEKWVNFEHKRLGYDDLYWIEQSQLIKTNESFLGLLFFFAQIEEVKNFFGWVLGIWLKLTNFFRRVNKEF